MDSSIAGIRRNYSQKTLSEADVAQNPINQFDIWWREAITSGIDEVNAMTLATASVDGVPSARIVLLKGFSEQGFNFFTNYNSFKGQQLAENPKACLVFFWKELERQVRITGLVGTLDDTANNDYFNSRPFESRIGALVSPQSQSIQNREWLEERYKKMKEQPESDKLERPGYWGGYIVKPVIIEFWQGRESRLHDRIQYTLGDDGNWSIERLAP